MKWLGLVRFGYYFVWAGFVFNRFDELALCAAKFPTSFPHNKWRIYSNRQAKLTKICRFFRFASLFSKWSRVCVCCENMSRYAKHSASAERIIIVYYGWKWYHVKIQWNGITPTRLYNGTFLLERSHTRTHISSIGSKAWGR